MGRSLYTEVFGASPGRDAKLQPWSKSLKSPLVSDDRCGRNNCGRTLAFGSKMKSFLFGSSTADRNGTGLCRFCKPPRHDGQMLGQMQPWHQVAVLAHEVLPALAAQARETAGRKVRHVLHKNNQQRHSSSSSNNDDDNDNDNQQPTANSPQPTANRRQPKAKRQSQQPTISNHDPERRRRRRRRQQQQQQQQQQPTTTNNNHKQRKKTTDTQPTTR